MSKHEFSARVSGRITIALSEVIHEIGTHTRTSNMNRSSTRTYTHAQRAHACAHTQDLCVRARVCVWCVRVRIMSVGACVCMLCVVCGCRTYVCVCARMSVCARVSRVCARAYTLIHTYTRTHTRLTLIHIDATSATHTHIYRQTPGTHATQVHTCTHIEAIGLLCILHAIYLRQVLVDKI